MLKLLARLPTKGKMIEATVWLASAKVILKFIIHDLELNTLYITVTNRVSRIPVRVLDYAAVLIIGVYIGAATYALCMKSRKDR